MAEQHTEAFSAIGITVIKLAIGAAWAAIVAVFTWMWATDRAVRRLMRDQEVYREQREKDETKDREERKTWRDDVMKSIERLGQRVGPLELGQAKQQGRDEALRGGPR